MKLVPKARPVQCKLILGGKVINTEKDLKDNFHLTEILALGEKFAQLLRRKEELCRYSDKAANIFKDSDSDEDIALALISLFFNVEEKTLMEILVQWINNGVDTKLLSNLLSVVPRDIDSALTLLQNKKEDDSWMFDWLKETADLMEDSNNDGKACADFCFVYSNYLRKHDERKAYEWLKEAKNRGHEEAARIIEEEIKNTDEIRIDALGIEITMVRVNDTFYIAKEVLPESIFLKCPDTNFEYIHNGNLYNRHHCEEFLKYLNRFSKYTWMMQNKRQWELANKLGKIKLGSSAGEWCLKTGNSDVVHCKYVDSMEPHKFCHLRPVLNIRHNPRLQ